MSKVRPLPRAVLRSVSLLALVLAAPLSVGAPLVPELLNGFGAASTFQVFAQGHAIEGGLYEWNDLCAHCEIRVTLGEGTYVANGETFVQQLGPGVYLMREFTGLFQFTQNGRHDFSVEFHGIGKVDRID